MVTITTREGKKGKTHKVTVRMKGFPTQTQSFKRLTDAKQWGADTESKMRDGIVFPNKDARNRSLGELIDKYIKEELPKKPRSEAKQKSQLTWWKNEIGTVKLVHVTPALLAECRHNLTVGTYETSRKEKQPDGSIKIIKTVQSRVPATANRYLAVLSHAFTVAVKEWGWVQQHPMSNVRRNKESKGRVRFLTDDERSRLLQACKVSRSPNLYLIVLLDICSGGRSSEIMGLTWADVSFDLRRIILRDTKNGDTRAVPLVGPLYDLLLEHKKGKGEGGLVFPRRGDAEDGRLASIRTAFENAVKRAGIEDFKFHDLRHTCASYLAMNGASLAEIAEVLGHKTLAMVKRYTHLAEQHTLGVVERMNRTVIGE
jgi:integrase